VRGGSEGHTIRNIETQRTGNGINVSQPNYGGEKHFIGVGPKKVGGKKGGRVRANQT